MAYTQPLGQPAFFPLLISLLRNCKDNSGLVCVWNDLLSMSSSSFPVKENSSCPWPTDLTSFLWQDAWAYFSLRHVIFFYVAESRHKVNPSSYNFSHLDRLRLNHRQHGSRMMTERHSVFDKKPTLALYFDVLHDDDVVMKVMMMMVYQPFLTSCPSFYRVDPFLKPCLNGRLFHSGWVKDPLLELLYLCIRTPMTEKYKKNPKLALKPIS